MNLTEKGLREILISNDKVFKHIMLAQQRAEAKFAEAEGELADLKQIESSIRMVDDIFRSRLAELEKAKEGK